MRCTLKIGTDRRQTKKRIIAVAFLACFIVVSLLSGVFILTHFDHVHEHGTCATCAGLQNAENILKLFSMTVVYGFAPVAWLYTSSIISGAICSNIAVITPITSKIRMNN